MVRLEGRSVTVEGITPIEGADDPRVVQLTRDFSNVTTARIAYLTVTHNPHIDPDRALLALREVGEEGG